VRTFEDILGAKRITFYFPSDTEARSVKTALFVLQLGEGGGGGRRSDGVILKPVTAPAAAETLYDRRFDVQVLDIDPRDVAGEDPGAVWNTLDGAAGSGVRRILFGIVEITGFDEISGFAVAKAQGVVTLFDRESGTVIRTWQVAGSGTGRDPGAARNQALVEMGRTLGELLSRTMP
jgi:hypothetical protein